MRLVSARQAIAVAYDAQLGVSWDMLGAQGGRADNCARVWAGLDKGRVIAVVEGLPAHQRAWALWCYTDQGQASDEAAILDWLCDEADRTPTVKLDGFGRMKRLLAVMHMLMVDTRSVERCGRHCYSSADFARRAEVDRSQFDPSRQWGFFRRDVDGHLNRLIADTLAPVSHLVDRLTESRAA